MTITINGESLTIPASAAPYTIAGLIAARQLAHDNLVVELNGKIIKQKDWTEANVSEGDRLELLAFVGGG
jgi:thiamine biosynthesis protein ThiS